MIKLRSNRIFGLHRKIVLLFCVFVYLNSFGQILFYQDICNCGVTGAGFSTSMGVGSGQFDIYIEPGSTIKKAYLFTDKKGNANPILIPVNGILINPENSIATFEEFGTFNARDITIYVVDVTNLINSNDLIYSVTIPPQDDGCSGCSYNAVYLYVLYENPLLEKTSTYIYINDINGGYIVDYSSEPFNPISLNTPVGFALYTDRIGISPDGSHLSFNNGGGWNNVGMIAGEDNVNIDWGGGVKGHFYYQNDQLFGLDDDTPDYIVGGSDGLVDISPFVSSGSLLDWRLQWETNSPNGRYNIYNSFFITHSTPCSPFINVSVSNDTTVCYGSQLQLSASGGLSYEWSPAVGLSCTDCPNPVFTADSSMFYTVRIFNNDTCSVVRPVKITVLPQPKIGSVTVTPTECGSSTGSASINSASTGTNLQELFAISENGDTISVVGNTITGLGAGNYTVFYTNTTGCKSADTVVTIGTVNSTVAGFTVTPQSGSAPLSVSVNNTSQNAGNYEWFVSTSLNNPISTDAVPPAYVFDTSGTYQIMLVAWQHDPSCADTAIATVEVYDSLMIHVPNVFTPNGDGINDFFSITVNQPVKCELVIVNRWGNEVFSFSGNLVAGLNDLWDASTSLSTPNWTSSGGTTDGVYFYRIRITEQDNFPLKNENLPLTKEGFVTVVR